MFKIQKPSKPFIIILLVIAAPIAFIVISYLIFVLIFFINDFKLRNSESKLREEFAKIKLDSSFKMKSQSYHKDNCLDSCPSFDATYDVSGSEIEIDTKIRDAFIAAGYTVEPSIEERDVYYARTKQFSAFPIAYKKSFSIDTNFDPTKPINNDGNKTVIISMEYNP